MGLMILKVGSAKRTLSQGKALSWPILVPYWQLYFLRDLWKGPISYFYTGPQSFFLAQTLLLILATPKAAGQEEGLDQSGLKVTNILGLDYHLLW